MRGSLLKADADIGDADLQREFETRARSPHQLRLSPRQKLALVRQRVKYVFEENRSFDRCCGNAPAANGLSTTLPAGAPPQNPYSQPANTFGSYHSVIRNIDGTCTTISPFLIPRTITNVNHQTVQLLPRGHVLP
jgi:phospholipase C